MKRFSIRKARRPLALLAALLLVLNICPATAFAEGVSPSCDETYYATLDYYGGLKDSSVVKSYRTNGSSTLTDFGKYDQITNLTDSRSAVQSNGKVTFDLSGDVPDKFYFEGKTEQPYKDFPWKITLRYALNGVPAQAEQLAGSSGIVDITLDAVPNPAASEYSRNNLVLAATSMFNGDDILSLEASGAQVQMVGNLYCVMYMALPGEEQHFTIRVGTEDFSYSGMIFLAVPATLAQLEQVADLREAKETTEDSYHAINDSMDAILDSMEGMSGHLGAAANGLDQLNTARGAISSGKGQVYNSVDAALAAVEALTKSLEPVTGVLSAEPETEDGEAIPDEAENTAEPAGPAEPAETAEPAEMPEVSEPADDAEPAEAEADKAAPADAADSADNADGSENGEEAEEEIVTDVTEGHLAAAQRALAETTRLLNKMNANIASLRPEVENTRVILRSLQDDLEELRERLDDAKESSNDLNGIAGSLTTDLGRLRGSLDSLRRALGGTQRISGVSSITVNGMTTSQIRDTAKQAQQLHAAYEASGFPGSFTDFLVGGAGLDANQAAQLAALYDRSQSSDFDDQLNQADTANDMIGGVNDKIDEINQILDNVALPASDVVGDLEYLTDDLARLSKLIEDLTDDSDDYSYSTLDTLDDAIELAVRVSSNVDTAIGQIDALTSIVNTYEPETQQLLTDTYNFTVAASISLSALAGAAKSAEDLFQSSGPSLDQGTQQALSGIASALRKSTAGLDQTDTVRTALDTIDELLTDQWDKHTGEENNILLMDAQAAPESITDRRNTGTASIQYVMRSQEIKADESAEEEAAAAAAADQGTFWSRIAKMFQDIWAAITGIFS